MVPRHTVGHGDGQDSPLPGLAAEDVRRLSESWDDGGLWNDILWLADRFVASEGELRSVAWHHLVMAVGNFKRQAGRRLRPLKLADTDFVGLSDRPLRVVVPGVEEPLVVDDSGTWRQLNELLPGAGVATMTTLLSALWPDDHIVFDWRVHAAANALRIHAGLEPTAAVSPDSIVGATETLEDYAVVRAWVLRTAAQLGQRPPAVERTLYRLSQAVQDEPGRTWTKYASVLSGQLPHSRGG